MLFQSWEQSWDLHYVCYVEHTHSEVKGIPQGHWEFPQGHWEFPKVTGNSPRVIGNFPGWQRGDLFKNVIGHDHREVCDFKICKKMTKSFFWYFFFLGQRIDFKISDNTICSIVVGFSEEMLILGIIERIIAIKFYMAWNRFKNTMIICNMFLMF